MWSPRKRGCGPAPGRRLVGAAIDLTGLAIYELHTRWAWFVVISNGLAGLWSIGAHQFPAWRRRALWWFIGIAEVSIFVQVAFGVAVVNSGRPIRQLHAFYGFLAIIAVAIIYSYRPQLKGKTYLLYGGGSLFVMGLCIRAMLLHR